MLFSFIYVNVAIALERAALKLLSLFMESNF